MDIIAIAIASTTHIMISGVRRRDIVLVNDIVNVDMVAICNVVVVLVVIFILYELESARSTITMMMAHIGIQ